MPNGRSSAFGRARSITTVSRTCCCRATIGAVKTCSILRISRRTSIGSSPRSRGTRAGCGVIDRGYEIVFASLNAVSGNRENGLVPRWCNAAGTPIEAFPGALTNYQYDSARLPFRIAQDWAGSARSASARLSAARERLLRAHRRGPNRGRLHADRRARRPIRVRHAPTRARPCSSAPPPWARCTIRSIEP